MKKIAVLGSTGSIGRQTLEVVRNHPDKFKVVSLCANSNAELLEEQINEFKPEVAGLTDANFAQRIKEIPNGTSLYTGENAPKHAVTEDCDVVVGAISGFAGLQSVIYAIKCKKAVALANKETLVAGGEIPQSFNALILIEKPPISALS